MNKFSSKLPATLQEALIEAFSERETICKAAKKAGVNKNTAHLYFSKLREIISIECNKKHPEHMNCYFIGKYFYHNGRNGFTKPEINNCKPEIGIKIIKGYAVAFPIILGAENNKTDEIDAIIYRVNGETIKLVKNKAAKRYQVILSSNIAEDSLKGDEIKRLYKITNERLSKSNGILSNALRGYIKECEWRANTPSSLWAYELKRLAKEYISEEINLGEKPRQSLGDDLALVRALNRSPMFK
ncbi:hypothetical protein NUK55_08645 [Aeromonas veronii]|uniref:hypothetical protein n=1 Tax=Aeromonas veronii TaxID=654 RepID=UPI00214DDEEE|nr:hypothetical protein [Aeromonas veronii]MCR3971168.1 hypothetical protein [Aeromonas veronii]MCR3975357.1 hypothetical protein [Aeromonas veronii]